MDPIHLRACGTGVLVHRDLSGLPDMPEAPAPAVRTVDAELAETRVRLAVTDQPPLTDLDIGEFGAYRFDASRGAAWILRPAVRPEWQDEALWGPLLLHALAHRGIYVLHASAAITPAGQLVAFVADSGVGKSTLALIARGLGWQRAGDDLLPVAQVHGEIVALPQLHQPKLAAEDQYPPDAPAALPLRMLVHLKRGDACALQPAAPRDALDILLANTVASRTYAVQTLAAHLAFARAMINAADGPSLKICHGRIVSRPADIEGAAGEFLRLAEQAVASA